MKPVNYKAPARALYNTFLRSALGLQSLYVLLGMVEWGLGVSVGLYIMPDIEITVYSSIDDLRYFYMDVTETEIGGWSIIEHAMKMNIWLNAVRGFYTETS